MVRYHQMRGRPSLWLPGTDHAGIATQCRELKGAYAASNSTAHLVPAAPVCDFGCEHGFSEIIHFVIGEQGVCSTRIGVDSERTLIGLSIPGGAEKVAGLGLVDSSFVSRLCVRKGWLSVLPPELGELKTLKVLGVDYNMLVSVPVELRQCVRLVELSLEHNKLDRPLLDFRAMTELLILRLFGNPFEFLPEILPLHKLQILSLANIKTVADENLRSMNMQIEMENSSYFGASRHKLSAFLSIFRFSS
ncbi:Rossmann-like alpha/beta/alpha sandwich [Corchorus capsularis]|uniref:Rossmann-like alpha/beta/alpha sandwich n=1 Tax=Corchorus capsularis TaxID=210143 RepID=A0A1R3I2T2_COCAP|nr:Rossmann-like alpha/beta/alpha sandwich [Corchorus capsularis]